MLGLDQRPLPGEQVRTSAFGAYDQDYEGIRIGGHMANRQDDGAPEPIRIDTLSPDLASEAGDLLAASHADYPSFRHLFPDPHRRSRVLRPFMSAAARDAAVHARAMAAYEDNGRIVGVALWMPPGTFPLSFWRKARMAPVLLQAALSARGAFPAFARVGAILEKVHPRDRSWYLQAMGVHPRAQRRGVGRGVFRDPAGPQHGEGGRTVDGHEGGDRGRRQLKSLIMMTAGARDENAPGTVSPERSRRACPNNSVLRRIQNSLQGSGAVTSRRSRSWMLFWSESRSATEGSMPT